MSDKKKTTLTFRFLKRLHLIENEEKHGRINPFSLIWFALKTMWRRTIFTYAYKADIFEFAYKHHLRPAIWRALGCKVGKRVHIGQQVRLDFGNAERITVEDDVVLANGVTLWYHMRDMKNYRVGMKPMQLPAKYGDIHLCKGCYIGLNVTILPGVTIGEGAVCFAGCVVTKDVEPYSVVAGIPARAVTTRPQTLSYEFDGLTCWFY